MTTSKLNIILLISILFIAPEVHAAVTTPPVERFYQLPPQSVPNPSTVHARWKGTNAVASWWVNLWGSTSVHKNQIKAAIEDQIQKQKAVLEWSGNGALLNIMVIRAKHPETGLQPVAVLREGALVLGFGKSPDEVLVNHWSGHGVVDQGIPQGWVLDEVMSTYVWIESIKGKIVDKAIPRGTMLDLNKNVRENFPVLLRNFIENKTNNMKTWAKIADTAKRRDIDRAAKMAIDRSLKAVGESQKRVAEINGRLRDALEREKKASEALLIIKTLQGILTVVDLAMQASELLDVSPQTFANAESSTAVLTTSTEIVGNHQKASAQLKVDFKGSTDDLDTLLKKLWIDLKRANPPPVLEDKFQVDPRIVP